MYFQADLNEIRTKTNAFRHIEQMLNYSPRFCDKIAIDFQLLYRPTT